MKMRNGFVSNSSSSSFILSFNEHPSNKETLQRELFGDQDILISIYDDSNHITVDEGVDYIYSQIEDRSCATKDEIIQEFNSMFYNYNSQVSWEESQKKSQVLAEREYDKFIEQNKDKFIYIVECGDDSRVGGILEHSEVINEDMSIKVSHH